jgi:hypothetical protein
MPYNGPYAGHIAQLQEKRAAQAIRVEAMLEAAQAAGRRRSPVVPRSRKHPGVTAGMVTVW